LFELFSNADKIARETKFIQRKSPFSGEIFLKTILFGFLAKPTASLNDLAQKSFTLGVKITPQGIHDRINQYAVKFLKAMFQFAFEQLKSEIALPLPILQQFTAVNIVDSTTKPLPECMAAEYPGSGGNGSKASLKVQLVLEFLHGNLTQLAIEAGTKPDQGYTQYLDIVQIGSLTIVDLGYFCLSSFQKIMERKAYFLSRFKHATALFSLQGERLNLFQLLPCKGKSPLDINVEIGVKQRLPCRLIAIPVPAEVAEERRRKAKRKEHAKGKAYTKEYLSFLGWSVFITNVPNTFLSDKQVIAFYRIRWQIELVFKFWKSFCGIGKITANRQERVMIELYAKLLLALLANFLIAPLRIPEKSWDYREISTIRVYSILSLSADKLRFSLTSLRRLNLFMISFLESVLIHGLKQKRKSNPHLLTWLSSENPPLA
jgi:hypothetical protein